MAEKTCVDGGAGKLTQLPVARIKTIMKSSPDQPHFSQESVFLVTKATVSPVKFVSPLANSVAGAVECGLCGTVPSEIQSINR